MEDEVYMDEEVQKDMRYISNRLQEVREDFGESQLDFAETLQLSRKTVCRQESGLNGVSLDYLLRLLRATKTTVASVFPPDLRGESDEIEKMFAQLNENNKSIVQSAVKNMMIGMLATQNSAGVRPIGQV